MNSKEEWLDLYEWSREFRSRHDLTCRQFLELCGLTPSVWFIQLLSEFGRSHNPSNLPYTKGYELRTVLKNMRTEWYESISIVPLSHSKKTRIEDYFIENEGALKQRGIVGLYVACEDPLRIEVDLLFNSDILPEEIARILSMDGELPNITIARVALL